MSRKRRGSRKATPKFMAMALRDGRLTPINWERETDKSVSGIEGMEARFIKKNYVFELDEEVSKEVNELVDRLQELTDNLTPYFDEEEEEPEEEVEEKPKKRARKSSKKKGKRKK